MTTLAKTEAKVEDERLILEMKKKIMKLKNYE